MSRRLNSWDLVNDIHVENERKIEEFQNDCWSLAQTDWYIIVPLIMIRSTRGNEILVEKEVRVAGWTGA